MKHVSKKQAKHFREWMAKQHPHIGYKIDWYYMDYNALRYADKALGPIGIELSEFSGWAYFDRMFFAKKLDEKPHSLLRVTMHEFRHIMLGRRWGWGCFNGRYLTSERRRRDIEVDGYCGNLQVERFLGIEPDWDRYTEKLSRYKVERKHIRRGVKKLKAYDRKIVQNTRLNHMFYCWEASGCERIR